MHALGELMMTGRLQEAAQQSMQRLARDPGDGEALLAMARLSLLQGCPDDAEQWLIRAPPSVPPGEKVMVRAAIACQRGRWEVAKKLYASLVHEPAPPLGAWYGLGVALLSLGDLEGAREAQELALQAAPEQASIHFELGRLHALQGRTRAALRAFVQTLRREPRDARAHGAIAQLLMARGKGRSARRLVEAELQQQPSSPELQRLLGTLRAPPTPSTVPPTRVRAGERARHTASYPRARWLLNRKDFRESSTKHRRRGGGRRRESPSSGPLVSGAPHASAPARCHHPAPDGVLRPPLR